MKRYSVLAFIIGVLFFSCKESKSKKINTSVKVTEKEIVPVAKIDTSFKKNIRLYDQYYYDMPSNAADEFNTNDDVVTITYKKQSIDLKKSFTYEKNLLKAVMLSGDSFYSAEILSLFKEKYGEPIVLEKKEKSTQTEIIPIKILKIKDELYVENPKKFDKAIHREISNQEFNNYLANQDFPFIKLANSKLHIMVNSNGTFYKVMKDITKDEFVIFVIEVAIQKNEYTKTQLTSQYTWIIEKKEIKVTVTKQPSVSGNKIPVEPNLHGNLTIEFSSLDDKITSPKTTKENNPLKELEKKSLEAI